MSTKDELAFPVTEQQPNGLGGATPYVYSYGISIRLWLAGQALAGVVGDHSRSGSPQAYAQDALMFADALIEEYDRKIAEERDKGKGVSGEEKTG